MRTTSNPAFRNLPGANGGFGSGYGGFGGQSSMGPFGTASTARGSAAPLTLDDVVTKTAITFGVALVAGVLTAVSGLYALVLPGFIVGLVLSLVIIFKQSSNPALVLGYSAAEGVVLGGLTGLLQQVPGLQGIGFQAIVGTSGVFIGMLVVYKTGAVRVTPRLTKWIIGATVGVVILMLANLVVGMFTTGGLGLRDGSPLAWAFSLLCIGIAAFSLLLDFDAADRAIKVGAPARFGWYLAFGLMTTMVWLYLEILRLLSYLNSNN